MTDQAGSPRTQAGQRLIERLRWNNNRVTIAPSEILAIEAEAQSLSGEREGIEQRARLQDAYDALRAAVLWLHGEHRDRPRSEFDAQSWYRKARSGNVGLRDYLASLPTEGGDR